MSEEDQTGDVKTEPLNPDVIDSDLTKKLATSAWGRRILWIVIPIAVLGPVFAGLLAFVDDNHLITPARGWLFGLDIAVMLMAAVAAAAAKYVADDENSRRTVFWSLVGGIAIVVAALLWIFTSEGEPDLEVGGAQFGDLEADQTALHRFEVSPGDTVVIRIRQLDGLQARAFMTIGSQEILISPSPEGGDLGLSKTLVGGVWTLQIDSINGTSGRYRVDYNVIEPARPLNLGGNARGQRVTATNRENAYLIELETDTDISVQIDASGDDVPLKTTLFKGVQDELTRESVGDVSFVIPLEGSTTYLLVVGFNGTSGSYQLSLSTPEETVEPPVPTTQLPELEILVPDIYDLAEADAYASLSNAGLSGESILVCSGSVSEGRVRQAFILSDNGNELIVSDEPGAATDARGAKADQTVFMKISTGEPCG